MLLKTRTKNMENDKYKYAAFDQEKQVLKIFYQFAILATVKKKL